MSFQQAGTIRYFTFTSLLEQSGIFHAVLTRRGGSSSGPWSSLNLGGSVGDNPENVIRNKFIALDALQRPASSIFDVWQVHGNDVVVAKAPRSKDVPYHKADIILSDCRDITLLMRFADCVPILLHDPVRKVVGLVHAGWKGTVIKTARVAVETMQSKFHSNPLDILAAIGPSIGPDHYQVGGDVICQVEEVFDRRANDVLLSRNGDVIFDLWAANRLVLEEAGVRRIESAEICTACHPDDWFSHRGEQGKTGRFGVLIGLR